MNPSLTTVPTAALLALCFVASGSHAVAPHLRAQTVPKPAGQQTATWTTYTNGNSLWGVAVDPATGDVWAASKGGAIRWAPAIGTYTKYTTAEGLIDNDVRRVAIEPGTGARWFSTSSGASRWAADGVWTDFLAGQHVQDVAFGLDGSVWFGTWLDGALRLNVDGTWTHFTTTDGLPHSSVQDIEVNAQTGLVWLATHRGVVMLTGADTLSPAMLLGVNVNQIEIEPRSGDAWAATQVEGASRLSAAGQVKATLTEANSGLIWRTVHAIAIDPDTGDTWFATNMGLNRLAVNGQWSAYFDRSSGLTCDGVLDLAVDPALRSIWIATLDSGRSPHVCSPGLNRFSDTAGWSTYRTADGLQGNVYSGLAVNQVTGDVWVASGGAANRLGGDGDWTAYPAINELADNVVEVETSRASGDTWFAAWGSGATRLTTDGVWQNFSSRNSAIGGEDAVSGIVIDESSGDVWFSTYRARIVRRTADGVWTEVRVPGVPVESMPEGLDLDRKSGAVWFGIPGSPFFPGPFGAFRLAADGQMTGHTTASTGGGLVSDAVGSIAVNEGTGAIWFGTDHGASRLDADGTWSTFSTANGLPHQVVNHVVVNDLSGDVWFGTQNGAARLAVDGSWRYFTAASGLPSSAVSQVDFEDDTGAVWFTTAGGISRLGPPRETDTCATAAEAHAGTHVSSQISNAADVDLYRLAVTEPFSRIDLNIADPEDRFTIDLFRTCDGDIGAGRGRHVGAGRGRHIGGEQRLVFDVGNQTGDYYIAVAATAGGDFPRDYTLGIGLTVVDPAARRTLILTHEPRVQTLAGLNDDAPALLAWRDALARFAADPAVAGVLVRNVQTDTSPAVAAAYSDWFAHTNDAGRANAVAEALRDWIWQTRRDLPRIQYVVLVGDDRVIPHGRVAIFPEDRRDDGWVTEPEYLKDAGIDAGSTVASALAQDFTLSDDVYAAPRTVTWGRRGQSLSVPELAVGRLVEQPADMTAALEAFLASGGELRVESALLGGYDFMGDAAQAADRALGNAGLGEGARTLLLGQGLRPDTLRAALFGAPRDLAFVAAHANHHALLLPDSSRLNAAEYRREAPDLAGRLSYTLACHAGLNVPGVEHREALDFPEALLGRGAAYIGASGWAYGLDKLLAYNEELMVGLTRALAEGGGAGVGDALIAAKQRYLLDHEVNHMHAKAVAGTVLYGLPMLRLRIGAGSGGTPLFAPLPTAPADPEGVPATTQRPAPPAIRASGLRASRLVAAASERWMMTASYPFDAQALHPVNHATGSYFTFGDRPPRAEAGEPVQPLFQARLGEVAFDDRALAPRGVVLTAGRYHDVAGFRPLIEPAQVMMPGAAGLAPRQAAFSEPVWYPTVPVALRRLARTPGVGAVLLGADEATLLVTVGQYHAPSQTERLLDSVTLDQYYSASADQDGPFVRSARAVAGGGRLQLTVDAVDAAGIDRVVAAYADGAGAWASVALASDDGALWRGALPVDAGYFLQLVDQAGNVTTVDEQGRQNRPCGSCGRLAHAVFLPRAAR